MLNFLDKLRSHPEGKRRQYVWVGAFAVTSVIFLLWLGTFKLQFSGNVTNNVAATSTPLQVLQNNFSQIVDSAAEIFDLDRFVRETGNQNQEIQENRPNQSAVVPEQETP